MQHDPPFNPDMSAWEDEVERRMNGAAEPLPSRALFWKGLLTMQRPDTLIKGIIDKGCFAEIYGPHGSGKSFLGMDKGMHVSLGWPWRGRRVHQGGVLYVSAESGTGIINRIDAFRRHHDIDMETVPFAVVLAETNLLDIGGAAQIIADASVVPDLALVVIDTAARTMQGSDEVAEDMGKFVAACDRIRAETGAAVLVVHHSGKDASKGSRGSTVLPAAVDAAIEVKNTSGTIIATIVKQRDGEIGAEIFSMLEVMELGTDSDGDPITSCVLVPADKPAAAPKPLTPNQETMFLILRDAMPDGLTVDEWNDAAKGAGIGVKRRATLTECRLVLKEKKLVHEYGGKWFAVK